MPVSRSEKKAQAALALAIEKADQDAQKLYKQHEKERKNADMIDRADLDNEMFVGVLEDERLATEKEVYAEIEERVSEARARIFEDHEKHTRWTNVADASWLPNPNSQAEINAFLTCWREQDYPNVFPHKEKSLVKAKLREDFKGTDVSRKESVVAEMTMCEHARKLGESILSELDEALVRQDFLRAAKLRESLRFLHLQILASIDKVTCEILQYFDMFGTLDVCRWSPVEACLDDSPSNSQIQSMHLKLGLFLPTGRPFFPQFKFSSIGITLDPEGDTKMPRALSKSGTAVRCVQTQFDPFSVFCDHRVGQKYYALNCILIIEALSTPPAPLNKESFSMREDKPEFHIVRETADRDRSAGFLEGGIRASFRLPDNIVLRPHDSALMGMWDDERLMWRPIGTLSKFLSGVVTFSTKVISKMAIIQEKAFDIPYARWNLMPLADDQVLFIIEGRGDHGDRQADREVKILIREHECRLFVTDRSELAPLRDNWMPPATLLRRLAKSGYNFLLSNKDADVADKDIDYVPGVDSGYDNGDSIKPKSAELELRAYSDMATFCTAYAFSSSNHNSKMQVVKENDSLALFRISKAMRGEGGGALECPTDKDSHWYGVRYERDRCTLGAFNDTDQTPDLSSMPGKLTHLNLHMLLRAEVGNDGVVDGVAEFTSHLLQNSIYQLLSLTRPLSWG